MTLRDLTPWKKTGSGEVGMQNSADESPVYSLHRAVNQLFDDFFTSYDLSPFSMFEGIKTFTPSIDMQEDEKEIRIMAELPGMDENDIELSLNRDALTIKGEKKEESESSGSGNYYMERSFGSFKRVVPLPANVDTAKADATFKKGILTVRLPKLQADAGTARKISIKT